MSNLIKTNNPTLSSPFMGFNDMFERFFGDRTESALSPATHFVPQADVLETETQYLVSLAVPGIEKKDFQVEVQEGILSISGHRKSKHEESKAGYHRAEINYGSFRRSFRLPDNVVAEKISATYTDGLLEVVLPKDEKKNRKHAVTVK